MTSEIVTPPLRCIRAITCAILLPSRGAPAASFALAVFLALGAALAAVAFLVAFPFAGATWADCARPLAFVAALRFAGAAAGFLASGSGCAASPRSRMRSQILVAATLLVLKRF